MTDDARRLAGLEDVARAVAAVVAHLLERDEPLDAADVDERAERHDAADDALDLLADLELRERLGCEPCLASSSSIDLRDRTTSRPRLAYCVTRNGRRLRDEVREVGAEAQIDVRAGRERAQAVDVDLDAALDDAGDEAQDGASSR